MKFIVLGNLPSKENSRRNVRNRRTGRPMSIKSEKALSYKDSFFLKVKNVPKNTFIPKEPLILISKNYYSSNRPDLSVSLLKDLLQLTKIIHNDRQIKEEHLYWYLDREHPRVEVELLARSEAKVDVVYLKNTNYLRFGIGKTQ